VGARARLDRRGNCSTGSRWVRRAPEIVAVADRGLLLMVGRKVQPCPCS
jgi:hypothetical protein